MRWVALLGWGIIPILWFITSRAAHDREAILWSQIERLEERLGLVRPTDG